MHAGLYRHYKGGYYQLLGVAEHTETKETVAVYISLDATLPGPRMRVRPLDGPEGFRTCIYGNLPRFLYIGDRVKEAPSATVSGALHGGVRDGI